jgi:predicted transcriptional regulator
MPLPTDTEIAMLNVLWERGPSTVREIHEQLGGRSKMRYTTVLKMLQIMLVKGLVTRDEAGRAHVYAASAPQQSTQRALIADLLDRAFGGSAQRLVLGALSSRRATAEELAEIRSLLDELENETK